MAYDTGGIWLGANSIAYINKVTLCQAGLVLGWVTVHTYDISVFNQATQAYSAWPALPG